MLLPAFTAMSVFSFFTVAAQVDSTQIKREMAHKRWVDNNMYEKNDAIAFIKLVSDMFTAQIKKHEEATGVYKRDIELNGCELTITTYSRIQESSFKNDRSFEQNVLVIDLHGVQIDGNEIRPIDPAVPGAIRMGRNKAHLKNLFAWSVMSMVTEEDGRFVAQHYEDHLQWAYQFLIDECRPSPRKPKAENQE